LSSSFSKASAWSTMSPHPWSISDFCRDLSTTSCTRQQLNRVLNNSWNSTTQGVATYLHPLLRVAHRLQVMSHSSRSNKVFG
jgi:hypothetical protein